MAKKIRMPPRSAKVVSGYKDQPMKREKPKVWLIKNSVSKVRPPVAMNAPPKMYNFPRFTYRIKATAVVTMAHIPAVTGRAKGRYQFPPVAKLIYKTYRAVVANPTGTKITGLGFRNHKGRTRIT